MEFQKLINIFLIQQIHSILEIKRIKIFKMSNQVINNINFTLKRKYRIEIIKIIQLQKMKKISNLEIL